MTNLNYTYHLRGRFWIESSQGTFLGQGRVALLEAIRDSGSISAAARTMQMSYRQAWALVQSMNTHSTQPLVDSAVGGKGGGGAILTTTGEHAITLYHQIRAEFDNFLAKQSQNLLL